jgi:hypothetical protein
MDVAPPTDQSRRPASDSVSASTFIGCQRGTNLVIAPGRVCQANTSDSGSLITLEYSEPMPWWMADNPTEPQPRYLHRRRLEWVGSGKRASG